MLTVAEWVSLQHRAGVHLALEEIRLNAMSELYAKLNMDSNPIPLPFLYRYHHPWNMQVRFAVAVMLENGCRE